ncbi:MAG: formimidoylglutamase [Chlorobi bacterium]|nr:formimidoylglutamase [Chlorobiota bacterium]
MEISHYFEPVDLEGHQYFKQTDKNKLGNLINVYQQKDDFPDLEDVSIAIIGVTEDRAALQNKGCRKAPDIVRDYLYQLYTHWNQVKTADLGNIIKGHTLQDTYFALKEAIAYLVKHNIVPVIIGGSQDLTFANYTAYQDLSKIVNIATIDYQLDLGNSELELDSKSFFSRIILQQPNFLFNYTNIGYQSYFVDQDAITLMHNMFFELHRLGTVRSNMEEAEPLIRDADILSFDISAVRHSDAPGSFYAGPNGFTSEEACKICRYAGMSDKLSSFGIYEVNPDLDDRGQTAYLAAQMVWYFIDGYMNRPGDIPEENSDDYVRFVITAGDIDDELIFLKSKKSDRWWMEVQIENKFQHKYWRQQFVPCSYQDYQTALKNEIPDRWWRVHQKLM